MPGIGRDSWDEERGGDERPCGRCPRGFLALGEEAAEWGGKKKNGEGRGKA